MKRYYIGWGKSELGFIQYTISERTDGKFVLYDDAMAEIERIRAEVERLKAPQKILQANEVTEPGWYWWREGDGYEWFPKQLDWFYVERMNKSVLIFWDYLGYDSQNIHGEFIGPIPYPEP